MTLQDLKVEQLQQNLAACRVTLARYTSGLHRNTHTYQQCAFCIVNITTCSKDHRCNVCVPCEMVCLKSCPWKFLPSKFGICGKAGFKPHLRILELRDEWIPAIEAELAARHPGFVAEHPDVD